MADYSTYYDTPTYGSVVPYIKTWLQSNGTEVYIKDISSWSTIDATTVTSASVQITYTEDTTISAISDTVFSNTVKTGTVTGTGGLTTVTGSGTAFTTEYSIGDYLYIEDLSKGFKIASIASDTSLTLETFLTGDVSGSNIYLIDIDVVVSVSDMFSSESVFLDGLYEFEYTIIADGTTYTNTIENYFYWNVENCVHSLVATIPNYCSNFKCNDENINYALYAKGLLEAMNVAVLYCNWEEADKIHEVLESICLSSNCNCNN